MTPLTSGRKNLSDIISRLNYVTPDYNGPTYKHLLECGSDCGDSQT